MEDIINPTNTKEDIKLKQELDEIEKEIYEKIDKGLIKAYKYEDCIEYEIRLEKLEGYDTQVGTYELIDTNNYTEEELLNDELMTTKIMLIEKDLKTEKILEALEKIVKRMKKQEEKEQMNRIIEYILSEEITKEVKEELIRKLGGGGKMDAPEVIGREFKIRYENGRKEGKKEGMIAGIMQTAKAMLKEKMSIDLISRITGLSEKEIEELQ